LGDGHGDEKSRECFWMTDRRYELTEVIDRLILGDNLTTMRKLPDNIANLIYKDPPFFSNKKYEVIMGDELRGYEDIWASTKKGDKTDPETKRVGGIEHYITYMNKRIAECYRLLKPEGSLILHCDYHANQHLRILLDDIFGHTKFRGEIIWDSCDTSGFKSQKKGWIRQHDTLLWYSKSKNYTFNKIFSPYSEDYINRCFTKEDEHGRRYQPRRNGKKQYLDESCGTPIGDVWRILSFQRRGSSKENLGIPTQKPEELLRRIILTLTNRGDLVLDPWLGTGTSAKVASDNNRHFLGIDFSPGMLKMAAMRLRLPVDKILNWNVSEKVRKELNGLEFQIEVCKEIGAEPNPRKSGDKGIDGWFTCEAGLQVTKQQANRARASQFASDLQTHRRTKNRKGGIVGVLVAKSFSPQCIEQVAATEREIDLKILLITHKEVFEDKNICKAKLKDRGIIQGMAEIPRIKTARSVFG